MQARRLCVLLLVLLHTVAPACVQQTIKLTPIALSLPPGTLSGTLKIVASDNEEITLCAGSGVTLSSAQFFGDRDVGVTLPNPGLFSIGLTARIANCPPTTAQLPIWADPATLSPIVMEKNCTYGQQLSLGSQATSTRSVLQVHSVVTSAICGSGPTNYTSPNSPVSTQTTSDFGYLATSSSGQCRCSTSICAANNLGPCVGTNANVHCSCANGAVGDGIRCYTVPFYKAVQVGVSPLPKLVGSAAVCGATSGAQDAVFDAANGWCVTTDPPFGQWMMADLLTPTWIGKVAIKGNGAAAHWLTSFKLQYSNDTNTFADVGTFSGNVDNINPVSHEFAPLVARYWRIYILAWHNVAACRFELYTRNTAVGHAGLVNLYGELSRIYTPYTSGWAASGIESYPIHDQVRGSRLYIPYTPSDGISGLLSPYRLTAATLHVTSTGSGYTPNYNNRWVYEFPTDTAVFGFNIDQTSAGIIQLTVRAATTTTASLQSLGVIPSPGRVAGDGGFPEPWISYFELPQPFVGQVFEVTATQVILSNSAYAIYRAWPMGFVV